MKGYKNNTENLNNTGNLIIMITLITLIGILISGSLYHICWGYIPSMQRHELAAVGFLEDRDSDIAKFLTSVNQQSWWHICVPAAIFIAAAYLLITISIGGWSLQTRTDVNKILGKFLLLSIVSWVVLYKFSGHLTYHHLYPQYLLTNPDRLSELKRKVARLDAAAGIS